jgi:hydrogenase nickel incorporation protein HypB
MCATCGCSDPKQATLTDMQNGVAVDLVEVSEHEHSHHHNHHEHGHGHHHHDHDHDHHDGHDHDEHTRSHDGHTHHHGHHLEHSHSVEPGHSHSHTHRTIELEQEILAKNNQLAERNRGWLAGRNILALNLVSSPGAGKTTLLERTIKELGRDLALSVIEGDQQTLNDAERIKAAGAHVVQINTGTACHLDASMVARALQQLDPPMKSAVIIENVGNLVCPALFDLGERAKVVVVSVTEGDDKPIKYPHMFRASSVMVLNKIDLLPYVNFDVKRCIDYARQVNPKLRVFQVSATRGDGLAEWFEWLRQEAHQKVSTVLST